MALEIRHVEPSDYQDMARIMMSPKVVWGTIRLPYQTIEGWRKGMANPRPGWLELVAVSDGVVVGACNLYRNPDSPPTFHSGELGIMVRDDWHGKGVGSALMAAMLDLADNWLGLHRVFLEVFTDNAPAIALYVKYGFEIECVHRDYVLREGQYRDAYAMSRIRE